MKRSSCSLTLTQAQNKLSGGQNKYIELLMAELSEYLKLILKTGTTASQSVSASCASANSRASLLHCEVSNGTQLAALSAYLAQLDPPARIGGRQKPEVLPGLSVRSTQKPPYGVYDSSNLVSCCLGGSIKAVWLLYSC